MKIMKQAIITSIVLIFICGIIYPLALTGISQLIFNHKANGSMILVDGKEVASELIGQDFTDTRFFRGRVSGINYNTYTEEDINQDNYGKKPYGGVASGSQNLAPSSEVLEERVKNDIDKFLELHPGVKKEDIPTDLLTSSASGLDVNISPEAAKIQIPAVSKASGISEADLKKIIDKCTEKKDFGFFGQPRVNIVKVNMEIYSVLSNK